MEYRIEVYDAAGVRRACYGETPLLEVWRRGPDQRDEVRGLLPVMLPGFAPGWRVRVHVGGALLAEAEVTNTAPEWSDARKLILEDYINFSEVMAFEAKGPLRAGNETVSRTYLGRRVDYMLRDLIQATPGPLHYSVAHGAYPDGAEREYAKFLSRKSASNELEPGGISAGQWVGADRIDASGAYAKDGDTIAGLVVDGAPWPEVRLMMIDCEETSRNTHAFSRHPEVAAWSDARYNASGYRLRADAAKATLQWLLESRGIDFIELNPHRDAQGYYDDRVDAYGRYIAMVHGGGQCFNAAMVELGRADVYLYANGEFHVPEMELKDFFSYRGSSVDSIEACAVELESLDARGGALELVAALACAGGGFVFDVDENLRLRFRQPEAPARVIFFDPHTMGMQAGVDAEGMANILVVVGNPEEGDAGGSYLRGPSLDAYGVHTRVLEFYGIAHAADAALLAEGLLDDIAYPARAMELTFFHGNGTLRAGDIVEVRGAPVQRLDPAVSGEWGGAHEGRLAGRVKALRHRLTGKYVETTAFLGSPLRSVDNPLSFMVRSQEPAAEHFQFRLDDKTVGLDQGFHLD